MTREEAIFCEKSYIGETNCTDCKYYATDTCKSRESHKMAVKALEQQSCISEDKIQVLDKISTEIEQLPTKTITNWNGCCPDIDYPEIEYVDKNILLSIIDKYKSESEDNR